MKRYLTIPVFLAGAVLGTIAAVSLTSVARDAGHDAAARTLPYSGTLDDGDDPFTGAVDLQFALTDENGLNSWSERHAAVDVHRGRFAVQLGAVQGSVPDWMFDAEEVYLSASVRESGDDAFEPLTGRQRIYPAALSVWSAEADRFVADGEVVVAGDLNLHGASARLGALIVSSDTTVPGSLRPSSGATGGLGFSPEIDGGSASVRLVEDGDEVWLEVAVDNDDAIIRLTDGDATMLISASAVTLSDAQFPAGLQLEDDSDPGENIYGASITSEVSVTANARSQAVLVNTTQVCSGCTGAGFCVLRSAQHDGDIESVNSIGNNARCLFDEADADALSAVAQRNNDSTSCSGYCLD
jgi:hypothetical protein